MLPRFSTKRINLLNDIIFSLFRNKIITHFWRVNQVQVDFTEMELTNQLSALRVVHKICDKRLDEHQ